MKTKFLIGVIFFLIGVICDAQDIHFSQITNTPLILNPSYCGDFIGTIRVMNNYKYQWGAVSDKPYKTFFFAADKPLFDKKLCLGLTFFNDKAGDSEMSTTQADFTVSSNLKVGDKDDVAAGLQIGYGQKKFDGKNLVWDTQWDGTSFNNQLPSNEPVLSNNFGYLDLSSGISWHHKISDINKVRVGFGAYHLNTPSFSFIANKEKLFMKFVTSASCEMKFKELSNTTYVPAIAWFRQGTANEIDLSLILKREIGLNSKYTGINVASYFLFGAICRWGDAFAPYVGYEYQKGISAGISYDINYSSLRPASYARGGFELHLAYRFVPRNITIDTTSPSLQQ